MHIHTILTRPSLLRIGLAIAMAGISIFNSSLIAKADEVLPSSTPDFPSIIRAYSDELGKIESDKGANKLFISAIGPVLKMSDVTQTLGADPLPAKLSKELLVPDLAAAVLHLMGSLAAWDLSSTVRQAIRDEHFSAVAERLFRSPQAMAWLDQQNNAPWHDSLNQLSNLVASPEWTKASQGESVSSIVVNALDRTTRLEVAAMQTGYQEWDRIRNWKQRVRELRGQDRLCGTWQWIVHNHQQHQEQKLSLSFPPAGNAQAVLSGLVERTVLGENVYLRWEIDGRVQEDSLQFNKDGQRLEGTFVNSLGGWGAISGKRTTGCKP
jgi:hypothetical protein